MNERLILMTKRLFRELFSRQRPGVRRSSGAFERFTAFGKLQRAGALQDALALMLIACVMAAVLPMQAQWEALPALPEPNGGFICGVAGGRIVVAGGTNWEGGKKNWLKTVHLFDEERRQWSTRADWEVKRAYGVCFQDDRGMLIAGGSDGASPVRCLVSLDGVNQGMTKDNDLPANFVLSAGGRVGKKFYVVGGTDDAANIAGITGTTHVISSSGKAERLADYPGKPFAVAASAVVGEGLFVFGGMNYDEASKAPVNATEAHAFSPAKNSWRKLEPLAVANRGLTAVTLDERHIYLAGGYTDDFTADAVIYDVKADSYRKAKPLPYAAMVALVKHEGFIYCLGGEDKKQSRTDKFYRIPVAELLK
ncbi:MAG: Kelch repeat-containing protein [Prosthecobacter sp.]|uniref:Kelch repeat-containing protein n=1 Tax=Prosthecobacter sp. TaxID=1965333 RepID=UPI0038FEF42C